MMNGCELNILNVASCIITRGLLTVWTANIESLWECANRTTLIGSRIRENIRYVAILSSFD